MNLFSLYFIICMSVIIEDGSKLAKLSFGCCGQASVTAPRLAKIKLDKEKGLVVYSIENLTLFLKLG